MQQDRCLVVPHRQSFCGWVCFWMKLAMTESEPAGHSVVVNFDVAVLLEEGSGSEHKVCDHSWQFPHLSPFTFHFSGKSKTIGIGAISRCRYSKTLEKWIALSIILLHSLSLS